MAASSLPKGPVRAALICILSIWFQALCDSSGMEDLPRVIHAGSLMASALRFIRSMTSVSHDCFWLISRWKVEFQTFGESVRDRSISSRRPPLTATSWSTLSKGEKGLDIALIDLAGGSMRRVWKTEFAENFPSWHPDGDAIIFYARKPSGTQLYIRSLSSDRIDALTMGDGPNFVGTLSPNGDLLAYSSERTDDREIYLRNLVGGEERRLTERQDATVMPSSRRMDLRSLTTA